MAELTARLRLIADIRNFSQNIQRGATQARTALSGLDRQVGRVGTGLNGANKASKSFFQTLRSNVATQIKAGIMFATLYQALITFRQTIGAAISEMFNLDEALRKVQSISKDADVTIEGLKNQLIKAAREGKLFGQTAAEVAVGMFEIVQAGFSTAEAFSIAEVAAQAATAGFTDAATAGKVITGALLAFNMEADKARYVSNVLFQTVDTGVVTFEQLAQGIGVAMAPAAQMNVTLEELGAAIALMTRKGIPANRAMTSLTRILFQFLDPSDKAFKAAKEMGFALESQTVKTHGLLGAMRLLAKATGGNEEQLADVFDRQRALIGAFSLLADGGEDWAEILVTMNAAQENTGATMLAWDERSKALTIRMDILRAQILALVVQGLYPLAEGLGVVVDWLSRMISDDMGVFKWLKDTATEVTGLSEAWNDFTRALKDMFAEGQGDRLSLMFWGMFVTLREGLPTLFETLALLLRIGTWALRNKPALIAIALAFGAMFISAHPLLATFQALLIIIGYMEKNWDKWWVKILGTTAAIVLAWRALDMLYSAFTASRLAMFLFNTQLKGVTAGTGLMTRAVANVARAMLDAITPMAKFFGMTGEKAAAAAFQVRKVADGLNDILRKPEKIARTVTVTTNVAQKAAEGAAAAAAKGAVGAGLVQGAAKGIGMGLGGGIMIGLMAFLKGPFVAGIIAGIAQAFILVAAALGISVLALVAVIVVVIIGAIIAAFLIYKYREEIWAGLKTLGRVLQEFFTSQLPAMMHVMIDELEKFFTETLPAWARSQFTAENMGRWFGRFLMAAILLVFWPATLVYHFRDKLSVFVEQIAGFLGALPSRVAEKIGDAAGIILDALVNSPQWYSAFVLRVLKFEAQIALFVAEIPQRIAEFIGDHWKDVLDFLVDVAKWRFYLERKFAQFVMRVAPLVAALPGKIGAWIGDHWKDIIGFLVNPQEWYELFRTLVRAFVDLVSEKIGPMLSGIGDAIAGGIKTGITSAFSGLGEWIVNAAKSALGPVAGWLAKGVGFLGRFFGGAPAGMQDILDWLQGGSTSGVGSTSRQSAGGLRGFASGVRNFMGGMALVGERGAELVRLPRGADVVRNADMGQATRGAAGEGHVSVSAEVNITTSMMREYEDLKRRVIQEVEEKLDDAAATAGLAKPRLGTLGAGIPRT